MPKKKRSHFKVKFTYLFCWNKICEELVNFLRETNTKETNEDGSKQNYEFENSRRSRKIK